MPGLEAKLVRVPSDPLVDGHQRLVVHQAGRECFSDAECAVVRHQAGILGEAAVVAGRTDTVLGARYRHIAKRRGNKRAIVAVGRSILVIIWHLLASDDARFTDLGADHFTKHLDPDTKKCNHIRQLEALGYTVTLTPAA